MRKHYGIVNICMYMGIAIVQRFILFMFVLNCVLATVSDKSGKTPDVKPSWRHSA